MLGGVEVGGVVLGLLGYRSGLFSFFEFAQQVVLVNFRGQADAGVFYFFEVQEEVYEYFSDREGDEVQLFGKVFFKFVFVDE